MTKDLLKWSAIAFYWMLFSYAVGIVMPWTNPQPGLPTLADIAKAVWPVPLVALNVLRPKHPLVRMISIGSLVLLCHWTQTHGAELS